MRDRPTRPALTRVAAVLLLLAVVLGVFCWWGLFTAAGSQRFDEMDGMYPFFAGVVAAFAVTCAIVLLLFAGWRRHRMS